MLRAATVLMQVLKVLNWIIVGVFALVLLASFVAEPAFLRGGVRMFGPEAAAGAVRDMRIVLGIGIVTGVPAHMIFTRLLAILHSVGAGDAFVAANGRHLQVIGWALLAIQIADLGFGLVAMRASRATGEYFGWSFSVGGWISVLLVFVLARVFTQGAAMRDDLEGTV